MFKVNFNVLDENNKYAHIVGNGANYDVRSNAHTVDWDGNGWYAGNLYVGGTSQDDTNAVRVATLDDIAKFDQIVLVDKVNGIEYIAQMRNGQLVTFSKCAGIEITTMPTKTDYIEGEPFDPTGMVISLKREDGATSEITDYTYDEVIPVGATSITFTATVDGTEYTVELPLEVTDIETALIDFEYTKNDDGTYTLTAWKGTYQGVESTELIIPNSTLIIL